MRTGLVASALLALAAAPAFGANTGELWEVSTVMDMPGMPAGMGSQKARVCRDKDAPAGPPGRSDCKVTGHKRSGLTESFTVSCPGQGEMAVTMTYNAARTEYKGTMKMSDGRRGEDMTINTSGRKLGACDPQVARAEGDARVAAARKQGAEAQAQAQGQIKQMNEQQIAECAAAVQTMDARRLGHYAYCAQNNSCDQFMTEMTRPAAVRCMASKDEFCKRYQTIDGFLRAKGSDEGARACNVSAPQLKASLCPRAAQGDNLAFLGAFCPAEAKPLAQKHCAGRSYTSQAKDKYSDFCYAYVSQHGPIEGESRPARAAAQPAGKSGGSTADKVQDGVSQGINKLKGLFGR